MLVANPRARVPKLPNLDEVGDEGESIPRVWHAQTTVEWRAIHRSPMASQFLDTDDAGLLKLIVLIDDFWKATSPSARKELAIEIRLQRLEFGLTPVARARMQWEVEKGAEAAQKAAKRRVGTRTAPAAPPADPRDALGTQAPPALRVVPDDAGEGQAESTA